MFNRLATLSLLASASAFINAAAQAEVVSLDSGNGYYNLAHELIIETNANEIRVLSGLYDDYGTVTPAAGTKLGQYSRGLGVKSPGDSSHQIDGKGNNDIVIFDFLNRATIDEITFSHVDANDTFDFFLDTNNDGVLELISSGINIIANAAQYSGGDVATVALSQLLNATGSLFGIGASGNYDNFKILGLTLAHGDVSPVPVPAALPLMATALAGFGFAKRKSKSKQRA